MWPVVYDVVAAFFVHDVLAVITYCFGDVLCCFAEYFELFHNSSFRLLISAELFNMHVLSKSLYLNDGIQNVLHEKAVLPRHI